MNPVFEIATTAIESVLCLSAVTEMSGKRYGGRKHLALLLSLAAGMTGVISILNRIQAFSFGTVIVGML